MTKMDNFLSWSFVGQSPSGEVRNFTAAELAKIIGAAIKAQSDKDAQTKPPASIVRGER
jgi:hypothetical protein